MPALIPASRQTLWRTPAVANFALGGLGTGFYAAAAVSARFAPSPMLRLAAWLGPALVFAGFAAVAAEAGRPRRGALVLRRVRSSWMSRELVLGGAFAALALLGLTVRGRAVPMAAAAVALLLAAAQGFIVRRARAIAAWDVSVMPALFVTSALVSGAGLLLVVEEVTGRAAAGELVGSLVLLMLAFLVWLAYLGWSLDPPFVTATAPLRAGPGGVALGALGYGAAWACAALALVIPDRAPVAALAGAFMIGGQGWAKWLLIRTAGLVRPVALSKLTLQRRRA